MIVRVWLYFALVAIALPAFAEETALYRGAARCQLCHDRNTARPEDNTNLDWVRLDEYAIWHDRDAHAQAYAALVADSETMQKMRRALNDPHLENDKRCLACHTIDTQASHWDADFIPRGVESPSPKEGVSCEVCHGPSSLWEAKHNLPSGKWQFLPSEKKQELGMIDIRNPSVRAELCLSCHLGSVKDGRVVTHEMFAAGHPPLPGFEMQAFGNAMPSHWRHLTEKPKSIRDAAKQNGYQTEALLPTDAALLGALIAVRESTELLQEQASQPTWPELAHYDCGACHHDLRRPSIRQARGFGGLVPGRPSLHQWPRTLAEVAVGEPDRFREILSPLTTALNQQPFGNRETISSPISKVTANLHEKILELSKSCAANQTGQEWYQTRGKLLLELLCNAKEPPVDLDAARQEAWLIRSIYEDAADTFTADDRRQFESLYRELDELLQLTIHPRDYHPADGKQPRYWQQTMEMSRNYNGERFQKIVRQIGALLLKEDAPASASL